MEINLYNIIDDLINQRALTIPVVMLRLEEKLQEYKSGWIGSGWNEPKGYVLDDVIEEDKYYNSTKAIFTYSA